MGSDGSKRKDAINQGGRAAAGAATTADDYSESASMHSDVPGRQTVPRAEIWAIIIATDVMEDDKEYKIYIDNQSVVSGLIRRKVKKAAQKRP